MEPFKTEVLLQTQAPLLSTKGREQERQAVALQVRQPLLVQARQVLLRRK